MSIYIQIYILFIFLKTSLGFSNPSYPVDTIWAYALLQRSKSDPTPNLSHVALGSALSWAVNISKDGAFTACLAPAPMSDHSPCGSHHHPRIFLAVSSRLNTLGPVVKTQKCQLWRKQDIVETLKQFLHLLVSFFSFAITDQLLSFSLPPCDPKECHKSFSSAVAHIPRAAAKIKRHQDTAAALKCRCSCGALPSWGREKSQHRPFLH